MAAPPAGGVAAMRLSVTPVACLSDNYAWLLRAADGRLAVCDPGEAGPVLAAAEAAGGRIDAILLTHHHGDHVGGVAELVKRHGSRVVGAAADAHRLPKLDQAVVPGGSFELFGETVEVLASDGHTLGHIAFHLPESAILLCGDTLFSLGCGRLLEGGAAEMFDSLQRLAALPPETLVCCGHEYSESNARFALTVEPDNGALSARAAEIARLRAERKPSVPTTIAEEADTNPFLRAKDVATLARIRSAKDNFR
jgi:hydroxyacylglutathione hydrolase